MIQAAITRKISWDWQRLLFGAIHAFLILYLAFVFSDGINFVANVSSYLLYMIYIAIFGIVACCVLFQAHANYRFASIAVYGFWLGFYFIWALLVAPYTHDQLVEVVRVLIRNATVLLTVPIALRHRRNITALANWIQLAVLVNCAICIWEYFDPNVMLKIAELRSEDIFVVDPNRAAGLWYNPNPAAFGFLLGALMSHWARGRLVWVARIAALVGIYLTVSRSGLYMLLLCGGLYALFRMRAITLTLWHWMLFTGALTLLAGALLGIASIQPTLSSAVGGGASWNIQRLLDVKEENSGDISRVELSQVALRAALRGPWYGRGIFTFQGSLDSPFKQYTDVGAHNIYIVILGEAGLPGVASFILLIMFGLWQTLRMPMLLDDRFVLGLLWMVYLFIGLVNHNQFTSFQGAIYAALLLHLPIAACDAGRS